MSKSSTNQSIVHSPRRSQPSSQSRLQKLRFLTESELSQIDQAVMDVGERGEVWLIKSRGYLKYIARVTVEELNLARVADRVPV